MIKKVTNFVLNKLHKKTSQFNRTNEGGNTIRHTRLKRFKKSEKKLVFAAQIVAAWYILILTGTYLTTDTGAYFNDVETISGTISVSEDFCKDAEKDSEFWNKHCKDLEDENRQDTSDAPANETTESQTIEEKNDENEGNPTKIQSNKPDTEITSESSDSNIEETNNDQTKENGEN
ncbi:hypothetical protein BABA_08716 [Neobacillus bataviensis LMG 21833]|uniref:YqxM protein n=1 Tax=Neobacillus bataviensis LMG 21833 TaxID=1117379 RepID=K6E861_9BACI|nr:SipW-dependent-type signal peptide-containing protein [Neobacillus bataviensis]EKN69496.1 hypothetical protein BABA_08716 [Neobacillus bataviensis LMG 21833]